MIRMMVCICLGALLITGMVGGCADLGQHKAGQLASGHAMKIQPSSAGQLHFVRGLQEPLLSTGPTSREENAALQAAIARFSDPGSPGNISGFDTFVAHYPTSHWRLSVLTNLGLVYYQRGYFSRAISAWQQAWERGVTPTTLRQSHWPTGPWVSWHACMCGSVMLKHLKICLQRSVTDRSAAQRPR